MGIFEPDSLIQLCNVPINITAKNQLDFSDASSQLAYFSSHVVISFNDFTFQRKDKSIKIPIEIDKFYSLNANYVIYRNRYYSDKYFYCFITNAKYINQSTTEIEIKTDVFQTWQFDINIKQSYIIRETVADDTLFLHTLPENLETGELKCMKNIKMFNYFDSGDSATFNSNYRALIGLSEKFKGTPNDEIDLDTYIGGTANCVYYYAVQPKYIRKMVKILTGYGQLDAILYCVAVPSIMFIGTLIDYILPTGMEMSDPPIIERVSDTDVNPSMHIDNTYLNLNTIDGYTPKNNKCYCYPYNYVHIENPIGAKLNLKYEMFYNINDINLEYCDVISATPSRRLFFPYYNSNDGLPSYEQNSIAINNFPDIPWKYDIYKNYIARNKNSLAVDYGKKFIGLGLAAYGAGSAAMAADTAGASVSPEQQENLSNSVNKLGSSSQDLLTSLANLKDRSNQPDNIKGCTNGSEISRANFINIYWQCYCCKYEYITIIDKYFSMYGYTVNRIDYVNYKTRPAWNYIETKNINIVNSDSGSGVPDSDLTEICNIFNNGVTIWHHPDYFCNYNINNNV